MSDRLRKMVKFGGLESFRWLRSEAAQALGRLAAPAKQAHKPLRIAIVSDRSAWCSEQQLNPFDAFRDRLAEEQGLSFIQIYLDRAGCVPPVPLRMFDLVMVKLSYRTEEDRAVATVRDIKRRIGDIPLVYMDGDDDLCIQWGDVIASSDLYVKCHAFADRQRYTHRYKGKSNLHDHAVETHGHVLNASDYSAPDQAPLIITHSGTVREQDLGKIMVGWNMALSVDILALWDLVRTTPAPEKTIDCSFRGSVKHSTITGYMRQGVLTHLENLSERFDIRVSKSHVSLQEYYQELRESRICVSPFGFGELCWRDFEAALCGSLLIKPDMSHIETSPDIFQPHVTYVPVKWDLSDLEDVCAHYLEHEDERRRIADNAFQVLDEYYRNFGFGEAVKRIVSAAGVRPAAG